MLNSLAFRSRHTDKLEKMPDQVQSTMQNTIQELASPYYSADQEDFTRVSQALESMAAINTQLLEAQKIISKSRQTVSNECLNAIKKLVNNNLPDMTLYRTGSCEPLFGNDYRSEYSLNINFFDNKSPKQSAYPEIEVRFNFKNIADSKFPNPLVLKLNFDGKATIKVAEPSDYFLNEEHKKLLEKILLQEANRPDPYKKEYSNITLDNDVKKLSNSLIDRIPSLYCCRGHLNIDADRYNINIARCMNEDCLIIKMIKSDDINKQCTVLLDKNKGTKILGALPSQNIQNQIIKSCLEIYRNSYEFQTATSQTVTIAPSTQKSINTINSKVKNGGRIDLEENKITINSKPVSGYISKQDDDNMFVFINTEDKDIFFCRNNDRFTIQAANFQQKDQQIVEELLQYFGNRLN